MSARATPPGIELSAAWMLLDAEDRAPTVIGPDPIAPVASTGKVAILATLAVAVERGDIDPHQLLPIGPGHHVGGTGLLRALSLREMSVQDLAVLTASVSDNIATNVLLERLGLAAVERFLADAGIPELAVLDVVRDHRGATVPPAFAVGSARGLCTLAAALGTAHGVTPTVRDVVFDWMRHNQDRAYVPDAFGAGCPGLEVVNKTGIDAGVLADTGLVLGGAADVAYAAVARWSGDDDGGSQARAVSALRAFGADLHAVASGRPPAD
ncbi:MAG TPA: serine hydrolase [Nocardioides sp.]|nr:serine hydrolase [Nocardioides sp.]